MIPKKIFLTKGVGYNKEKLLSFEEALRSARVAHLNLVMVSSILAPQCKIIPASRGLEYLRPGQIVFCVMARNETNESNRSICSSIGVAVPQDQNTHGYLSEHHSFGQKQKEAGDYAEDLAATMLATTLGLEFDPDRAWDEKKEIYRMSGKIVRTRNVTQQAVGRPGYWVTTFAAAVFCELEDNF